MIAYSISATTPGINNAVPPAGIPPNGSIPNTLQGTPFDLVTEDGIFSLYLNAEPPGGTTTPGVSTTGLTHSLYLVEQGVQKTIIPTSGVFTSSVGNFVGGSLRVNENLVMRFRVRSGSRLGHSITNTSSTTAGFINAHYVIE